MKLKGIIKLNAIIEVLNGLAIGGGKEDIEIGGIDNQVIKDPHTDEPYIPGSSIKGKMRFLTEWQLGLVEKKSGDVHSCDNSDCPVCRIFGTINTEHKNGPTRLIVRDSKFIGNFDPEKHIEIKYSTAINRLTGTAKKGSLRNMERVVPGVQFSFELVYRVFDTGDDGKNDLERFKTVARALQWLENDTLGGSGSRGCGKIKFETIKVSWLNKSIEAKDTTELIDKLNKEQ